MCSGEVHGGGTLGGFLDCADHISLAGSVTAETTVDGDTGGDTITVNEDRNPAQGGASGKIITVNVNFKRVQGDDGDDILTVEGNFDTTDGGAGTDQCTITDGNPPVDCES